MRDGSIKLIINSYKSFKKAVYFCSTGFSKKNLYLLFQGKKPFVYSCMSVLL